LSRVVIPKASLPGINADSLNRFRFRVMNKNRNLYSNWSVIYAIRRSNDDVDFVENPDSYSISSTQYRIDLAWFTPDISAIYGVSARYKFYNSVTGFYRWDAYQSLGERVSNSVSIARKPPSYANETCYGAQFVVKAKEYPNVENPYVPVSTIQGAGSVNYITTLTSHGLTVGDYVNIDINNGASDLSSFGGIMAVTSTPSSTVFHTTGSIVLGVTTPTGQDNRVQKVSGNNKFITPLQQFLA